MTTSIIPIGQTCNITFLMQNLKIKKQTTLFEWFVSNHLNNITRILERIETNTDTDIIQVRGKHIFLGDSNISSDHYTYEDFLPIYKRRRDRLVETIRSSEKILFVRFEHKPIVYTTPDIDNFIDVVQKIHPDSKEIKLLLISPLSNMIQHPALTTLFYNKHSEDPHCLSKEINDLFRNALKDIGYDIHDTTDITFNDISVI